MSIAVARRPLALNTEASNTQGSTPRQTDSARLIGLVSRIADDPRRWAPLLQFGPPGRRWWTRLDSDPSVDVWLLTWVRGHATDLHDHGSSSAAFTVVVGELEEVRASAPAAPLTSRVITRGRNATIEPGVIHDVRAHGTQPAVSIHAYFPPLAVMTYYQPGAGGMLVPSRTVATSAPEQED